MSLLRSVKVLQGSGHIGLHITRARICHRSSKGIDFHMFGGPLLRIPIPPSLGTPPVFLFQGLAVNRCCQSCQKRGSLNELDNNCNLQSEFYPRSDLLTGAPGWLNGNKREIAQMLLQDCPSPSDRFSVVILEPPRTP